MPPIIPNYPVAANYLLTIISVCTFFLALGAVTIRLHRSTTPRQSPTLLVADVLIFICGMMLCVGVILLMLSDDEPTTRSILCRVGGQSLPAALQTYTWIAAMRAFLTLRHLSCPPPSQQVYRMTGGDRCSRLLTISAIVTIAITAAILGVLPTLLPDNNMVIPGSITGLKCLPIFSWRSNLHYYSIILFFFSGLGLLYFAILLCLLLCSNCRRRRRRQRQSREQIENKHTATNQSVTDFLTLCITNVIFMALAGVSDKQRAEIATRILRWLFLWLAVTTPLIHAVMALTVHWRNTKRRKGRPDITAWSPLPKSFMHVQRLQESKTKWIFRVDWLSGPGVLQKGDLKIFSPSEKRQWNNEAYAARKLSQYPHPGLCRYLWISRSNPYRAVFACLIKEGVLEKGCRLICRLNHDGGELVRFLGSNSFVLGDVYGASLDISSALRHLKQLRLLHNAISSATVRVVLTNQGQAFKPVITDFEESFEVPMESLIHHNAAPRTLVGEQSEVHRPELNEDVIFSSDSRAFGLLLLDMLLNVLRRDGGCLEEEEEEHLAMDGSQVEFSDGRRRLDNSSDCPVPSSLSRTTSAERHQLIHPLHHSSSVSSSVKEATASVTHPDDSVGSQSDSASRHTLSTALTSRAQESDGCSTLPSRRLRPLFSPTLHHRRYCDYIQRRFPQWLQPGLLLDGDGSRIFRMIRERFRRLTSINAKGVEEMMMVAVSAWSSLPCLTIEEIDQSLMRIRIVEHNGLPSG